MVVHGSDPYNAEPAPHALAGRHLTPVDTFYCRNHGPVPDLDSATWRLRVDGLVAMPLELALGQLQGDFEQRTLTATLQCAGNRRSDLDQVRRVPGEDQWGPGATSTATWTGVRLADVLRAAGVQEDARHVCLSAPDRTETANPAQTYGSSVEIHKALTDEVLLAWQMNGRALPAVHGAPVRVVVPGYIGARSVKWVDRVTPSLHPSDNYFQQTAYRLLAADGTPGPGIGLSLGPLPLSSAILAPADGTTVPTGPTEVQGYAYAGDRGIARVELSLDDGATWVEAMLDDQAASWTWCLWRTTLLLSEGRVTISVRAWDSAGATQPRSACEVWNPKGYLNTSWARVTVTVAGAEPGDTVRPSRAGHVVPADGDHQRLAGDRVLDDGARHAEDVLDQPGVEDGARAPGGVEPAVTQRDELVGVPRRQVEVVQDHDDRRAVGPVELGEQVEHLDLGG